VQPGRLRTSAEPLVELLSRPRYEVIPLSGIEEAVLAHVPTEVKVTVTTSPRKGLEPTLALSERLAGHGYAVVPHLAARHVRDSVHLAEIAERLHALGIVDVLVMAGDAPEPVGEFDGSPPFLRALADLGSPFPEVGITGYPESHAFISDAATIKAMFEKETFGTYIVSQICFDAQVTAAWVGAVSERGTRLPIQIGLPGPVPCEKLLRISERIGVGDSLRFLGAPGEDFDPDALIADLDEAVGRPRPNVGGFHIFTFNDLEATERWRQRALGRLQPA
jgi:methylenetetrahydrofolate reductase (NADPH)